MKTTLTKNFCDLSKYLLGQFFEIVLRLLRFLTPIGLFNYVLQMRTRPTTVTNLGNHLTPESTYMFVAPGVILVNITGNEYKKFFNNRKREWNKNLPGYITFLQCTTYMCIIIYFVWGAFN
jgi:hypothetical protein